MSGFKRIVCATLHPMPWVARTHTILPFILQQSGIFRKTGSINFLASDYYYFLVFFFLLTHTLLV